MIKRRHFLQFTGSTLAALGWNQAWIKQQSLNYGKVLAQPTPRKLALLIGINEYQSSWAPLRGCVTDVTLQRELLVHRFGFQESDVITLINTEATRQKILQACEEHLIKQVKDNDVVVLHFSGHGDLVKDPDPISQSGCNGSLVPFDGQPSLSGRASYIMGRTIFLLMSALKTENVTFVMDSCFSGAGTRGNLQVRSISSGSCIEPSSEELEYQNRWLANLNLSPEEFKQRRQLGAAKGTVLAATQPKQLALDMPFDDGGFHAGLFTYTTTQYLWEQTSSSFEQTMSDVSNRMQEFVDQEPLLDANPPDNKQALFYFTSQQSAPAEAVITNVTGNQVELWLGGIRPRSLTTFRDGAILSVADSSAAQKIRVKIELRNGLIARGQLIDAEPFSLASGTVLQEQVRQLPKPGEINLRIGLDQSLGTDIEQAEYALKQMERIEVLPLLQGEIDYILGRMTESDRSELSAKRIADLPPVDSIGLFSAGLDPILIEQTFGHPGEPTNVAIDRLQPIFSQLLAVRILKTALNSSSSRLNVEASILSDGRQVGRLAYTPRALNQGSSYSEFTPVPAGTEITFQITNREDYLLYVFILAVDSRNNVIILHPTNWNAPEEVLWMNPFQTLDFPRREDDITLRLTGSGEIEIFAIISSRLLAEALQALNLLARRRSISKEFTDLPDESIVDISEKLLLGLNSNSSVENSPFLALYSKVFVHE